MRKFILKLQYQKGTREFNCVYIDDEVQAEKYIYDILNGPKTLSYDIETSKLGNHRLSGLSPYLSSIALFQFCDGKNVYIFDGKIVSINLLSPIFIQKTLVAHFALFDLSHTRHKGCNIPDMHCTMIMYNLIKCAKFAANTDIDSEGDGQVQEWMGKLERYGASLKAMAAHILGIEVSKSQQESEWGVRPLTNEQLHYAAVDVAVTYDCAKVLLAALPKYNLAAAYTLDKKTMQPVVTMMLNGLEVDTTLHKEHIQEWTKRRDDTFSAISYMFEGVNLNSPSQLSSWITNNVEQKLLSTWPRSEKTGLFKADAKTLSKYSKLSWVSLLLTYKKYSKLLSTYGDTIIDSINPVTGRLHGSYTLGYTGTGRLSSRSPNLQNIPRDTTMRSIFIAKDKYVYVGADYSQIEIRVAGILSRDKAILAAYKEGVDLHRLIVAKVTGKPIDSITKEDRQMGKAINFGLLFGMGWGGLIEYSHWNYGVTLTEEESKKAVSEFRSLYKDYVIWQSICRDRAKTTGETTTIIGKTRKLSDTNIYTCSVNHPVQGSAAEIVKQALCNLEEHKANVVNCVHDEIILEVPSEDKDNSAALLRSCMIKAVTDIFPNCPNEMLNGIVELKTGKNWSECH